MITAKLKRIVPLEPNAQLDVTENGETKSFSLIEFEPGPSKRYMITVDVGNMSPVDAHSFLVQMRKQLKDFFPEGTSLLAGCRNGHPLFGLYEVDIQ